MISDWEHNELWTSLQTRPSPPLYSREKYVQVDSLAHANGGNLGGPAADTVEAALFFFPVTLGNVWNTKMPSRAIAAVCSYITGNSCQRQCRRLFSQPPGLLCRLPLFALGTRSVLASAPCMESIESHKKKVNMWHARAEAFWPRGPCTVSVSTLYNGPTGERDWYLNCALW